MKMNAIIVDVDGTIAHNDGHRNPFEWAMVKFDEPIDGVIKFIQFLQRHIPAQELAIIYVSGRMDECYEDTLEWIEQHVGVIGPLYMRKTGDFRADTVVKKEIYQDKIEPFYDVIGILDDRSKVVKMWRELGLTCFQVADGDF